MSRHVFCNPRVAFLGLKAGDVCSGRVSVRGKSLTGDDSIETSDMNCFTAVYLTLLSRSILFWFTGPPQSSILKYWILVTALSSSLCCRRKLPKRCLLCSVQVIPSFHISLTMVRFSIQNFPSFSVFSSFTLPAYQAHWYFPRFRGRPCCDNDIEKGFFVAIPFANPVHTAIDWFTFSLP